MKNLILTPNPYRDKNFHTLRNAMQILKEAGFQVKVCLPFEVDHSCELPRDIHFSRLDRELGNADLVICFGGDGTILHMAKAATKRGLPLLGVNIGTMGFMAELESTELDKLKLLSTGKYRIDSRMMLDVTVQRDREIIFHDICLNDAVITKGAVARIVHLAVKCDGIQAMECGGDGIIISTPTGSTAYTLSAGGPIIEPNANCMAVTPICAHELGVRPFVLSDERVVTIAAGAEDNKAYLSSDGGTPLELEPSDTVTIRRSQWQTRLVRLKSIGFYQLIYKKLSI